MVIITKAVTLQIIIVSINGSKIETIPSCTGSFVLATAWAIAADPKPAPLEKALRLIPCTKIPISPPSMPDREKALLNINPNAAGIALKLAIKTHEQPKR